MSELKNILCYTNLEIYEGQKGDVWDGGDADSKK